MVIVVEVETVSIMEEESAGVEELSVHRKEVQAAVTTVVAVALIAAAVTTRTTTTQSKKYT